MTMTTPIYAVIIYNKTRGVFKPEFALEERNHEIIFCDTRNPFVTISWMPEDLKEAIVANSDKPETFISLIDELGYALFKEVDSLAYIVAKVDGCMMGWDSEHELKRKARKELPEDAEYDIYERVTK